MLLIILALFWVAILAPVVVRRFRDSGTEPLVRVMAEGENEALVAEVVDGLCALIAATERGKAA